LPRYIARLATLLALMLLLDVAGGYAQGFSAAQPLGPEHGWIIALAAASGPDGETLWAASNGGRLYSSVDDGASWEFSSSGITDPVVTGVTASPSFATDSTVFAAADNGVFRSRDGGATWQAASAGLGGHFCRAVALDPQFNLTGSAYVSTDSGVYVSHDGGTNWFVTSLLSPVISLAVGRGGLLLAGLGGGGLERSADGGASWFPVSGFPSMSTALSLAVRSDGVAIVGSEAGIWSSTDSGATWRRSSMTTGRIDAVAFAAAPVGGGAAFAGSASGTGAYTSTDGGQSWDPLPALSPPFVSSLATGGGTSGGTTLWAGTAGGGVFALSHGGAGWVQENSGLQAAQIDTLSVSNGSLLAAGLGGAAILTTTATWKQLSPGSTFVNAVGWSGNHIFAGTEDRGLRLSYDDGQSWLDSSIDASRVSAVGLSPGYGSDGTVLAAADYVYRSTDAGFTWSRANGIAGNDVRRFAFSPSFASDGNVYAITINHQVSRSDDGGRTWLPASHGLPSGQISDVLLSPAYDVDGTLYAATSGDGVYRSSDRGLSWAPLPAQPPQLVVSALGWTAGGTLLAGTEKGLFELDASGWRAVQTGWDLYVTALADVTTGSAETLYVGTLGNGLWRFSMTTPTPQPTGTPTATGIPITPSAVPSVTSASGARLPRAWVVPKPIRGGDVALLRVQGRPNTLVTVVLSAPGWSDHTALHLDAAGHGSYGFLTPHAGFRVTVASGSETTAFTVTVAP
jgi:hypothetical protein